MYGFPSLPVLTIDHQMSVTAPYLDFECGAFAGKVEAQGFPEFAGHRGPVPVCQRQEPLMVALTHSDLPRGHQGTPERAAHVWRSLPVWGGLDSGESSPTPSTTRLEQTRRGEPRSRSVVSQCRQIPPGLGLRYRPGCPSSVLDACAARVWLSMSTF